MTNTQQNLKQAASYEAELLEWHAAMEKSLRSEDSWLTLAGLFWLHEGENTIGSDATNDVTLPAFTPAQFGVITLHEGKVQLRVPGKETVDLLTDHDVDGPTRIKCGAEDTISFYVIKRADQYGIRVKDMNSPERQNFTGRVWFPVNPDYHVRAVFHPYAEPRTIGLLNTVGLITPESIPGYIEFTLHGQTVRLEALDAGEGQLQFMFKDATNGGESYGSGRYLYHPLNADNTVDLDFNRAYNPPCAFTKYATCALPPRENYLSVRIEAGERYAGEGH